MTQVNYVEMAAGLTDKLGDRAAACDEGDLFVAQSYPLLKQAGLSRAGVPQELGGGGASVRHLCETLAQLAQGCSSTALALSMHTHQVKLLAKRWQASKCPIAGGILQQVMADAILISSGGSDWIHGSGTATKVAGGYRINARKVFSSGVEVGDVLMTSARLTEDNGSTSVLHFPVSLHDDSISIEPVWKTLGMRGTGSHDVLINDFFLEESQLALSRPAGEWHPLFHFLAPLAFTLVYAVYVGIAEKAVSLAINMAKKRHPCHHLTQLVGQMQNALCVARLGHQHMLAAVELENPSMEVVNQAMTGRQITGQHAIKATELALEVAGGAGFYRAAGLERLFRDIQAARYHPLQTGPQQQLAGAMALGLAVEKIF